MLNPTQRRAVRRAARKSGFRGAFVTVRDGHLVPFVGPGGLWMDIPPDLARSWGFGAPHI